MELIRSATPPPSAQQPEHSPHDKNQYRNRENAIATRLRMGLLRM